MKNLKNILKQNSLTSGIIIKLGLGLGVALLVICSLFVHLSGVSMLGVAGVYILVRSIFKIIRLAIGILFSLLAIVFLVAVIAVVTAFIF